MLPPLSRLMWHACSLKHKKARPDQIASEAAFRITITLSLCSAEKSASPRRSGEKGVPTIGQHLRQRLRVHAIRHGDHLPLSRIDHLRIQILLSVKRLLEQLRFFSRVLINDMTVHIRGHVNLGMARIPLHSLYVAAIQLQYVP